MSIMTVDIAPRQLGDPVYVSQGDIGRIINVHMYDGDDPYIPPAGVTPYIQGLKPSGLGFNVQGTITDNICTFSTTDEMTDEVGDMVAEVRLIKTGMDIGTANFRYSVEERPRPDGTTDGAIEVITDVIADALNDALDAIETARAAAVAQLATAGGVVARTVAEMTDESAVYLYTGSETGYTAGNWYYYNGSAWTSGGTYGGAVTDTTLSVSGAPADAKAVGDALAEKADADDVTALTTAVAGKADSSNVTALDDRVTVVEGDVADMQDIINEYNGYKSDNLHDPTTTSDREGRWNADGSVTTPEKLWRRTALIDVSDFNQIEYTGIEFPQNDAYALFFGADESTVTGAFVPVETMGTSVVVDIPVDTKYVTFTVHRDRCTTLMIYGIKHGTIVTRDELDSIKADVDTLESGTGEMLKVYEDGYHYINTEWENGSWTGVNEKHGYNYQVRSVSGVVFTEDTLIKADVGFQISGFVLLADGTSQGIGRFSMSWLFPAGSTGYIVVRRRVIDTEEIPDPVEFGAKLKIISGRMTEHNAVRDTFYGIEMFESVAICGDSYSEGRANHSWGKCLGRQTGVNVSVFAKSGDNSGEWRVNATKGLPALLAAPACELYWINHGINDSARYHDNPPYLGSVADLTGDYASYPDTFWGNMGCIIESIKAHAPNALLILEKAMWHNPLNTYIETSVTNIPVINQAIEDIGEHYGIPVIDMLDDVFYWSGEWSRGILSNHPDIYMYPGMASANRRLFSRCVRDNYSYFANWLL